MTYKAYKSNRYLVSLHGGAVQSPVKSPVGSSTVHSRIGLVSWKYPALWLTLTNPHLARNHPRVSSSMCHDQWRSPASIWPCVHYLEASYHAYCVNLAQNIEPLHFTLLQNLGNNNSKILFKMKVHPNIYHPHIYSYTP